MASLAAVVGKRPDKISHDPKHDISKYGNGIVHFNIWSFGKWTEVVIDDRLPVLDSHLIFAQATHDDTCCYFWVPLMEKAFAKYADFQNIS